MGSSESHAADRVGLTHVAVQALHLLGSIVQRQLAKKASSSHMAQQQKLPGNDNVAISSGPLSGPLRGSPTSGLSVEEEASAIGRRVFAEFWPELRPQLNPWDPAQLLHFTKAVSSLMLRLPRKYLSGGLPDRPATILRGVVSPGASPEGARADLRFPSSFPEAELGVPPEYQDPMAVLRQWIKVRLLSFGERKVEALLLGRPPSNEAPGGRTRQQDGSASFFSPLLRLPHLDCGPLLSSRHPSEAPLPALLEIFRRTGLVGSHQDDQLCKVAIQLTMMKAGRESKINVILPIHAYIVHIHNNHPP